MRKIRIGCSTYLSVQPLVCGLTQSPQDDVELVHDTPGQLAVALERGRVDAALVPAIEFLRGVGKRYLRGPAQIATGSTGSLILATNRKLADVERIAVDENSRTPLAVLRIVLDKLHKITPDFCVFKGDPKSWCDAYDGVLFTGDSGLDHFAHRCDDADVTCYDLGEMWNSLFPQPLVLSVWAYNDDHLEERLRTLCVQSRDYGVKNLDRLSKSVAKDSEYDAPFLRDYYSNGWSFDMDRGAEEGLRVLETCALEYELIRRPRLVKVLTG